MDCEQLLQIVKSIPLEKSWVDISTALLTPVIGTIAIMIGYFQWKINQSRLKHELFDKRYNQFIVIKTFLVKIFHSGTVTDDDLAILGQGTKGFIFLFDEQLEKFLNEKIRKPARQLEILNRELDGLKPQDERHKNVVKQRDLKNRLNKEYDRLESEFTKYLQLKH